MRCFNISEYVIYKVYNAIFAEALLKKALGVVAAIVIFIYSLRRIGLMIDKKSYETPEEDTTEEDTSMFGIDWDDDGKVSLIDDIITMELLDDFI